MLSALTVAKNRFNGGFAICIVMVVTLVTGTAWANGEEVEFEPGDYEVAKVEPITSMDRHAEEARKIEHRDLQGAATIAGDSTIQSRQLVGGGEGFAFGGQATQAEVKSLHFAHLLNQVYYGGAVDEELLGFLKDHLEELKVSDVVRDRVVTLLSALRQSDDDPVDAMFELRRELEEGMTGQVERSHGYFLVGLWVGESLHSKRAGGAPQMALGEMMIQKLEQDAAFRGADEQLAEAMRGFLAELRNDDTDLEQLWTYHETMLSVEPDVDHES